jgi:leucyl aminopeptidase
MKVFIKNIHDTSFPCDALVLPVPEGRGANFYRNVDRSLSDMIRGIIASGEFTGTHGETSLIHTAGKIKADRVLLIGIGKKKELTREKLRQAGGRAASCLENLKMRDIAVSTKVISSLKFSPADFIEGSLLADYRFVKYRKNKNHKGFKKITVLSGQDLRKQIRWIEATASAAHFARDLVNTPSNVMTPSALAAAARTLKKVTVKVIEKNQAVRLGMGAYVSVAKGSQEPPKFIVLRYKGNNARPLVLIGKSITFDSGGISLKPREGMEKMKYDMAGGAAVLGVMKVVSEMKLGVHLICILPAAENLPGGSASKPGDVVKTISGRSIEIVSTDAEGRLTLADAIEYAKRFKPSAVIDIATLTGACSITFGNEAVAMMGNDRALMEKMKKASDETSERVWQMPLFEEYGDYIKSDIADLKNSSGRSGSLASSAYFLKEFAGDTPWVHLDIAGTAWTDKERPYIPKGATGIGVRLLLRFLTLQSSSAGG